DLGSGADHVGLQRPVVPHGLGVVAVVGGVLGGGPDAVAGGEAADVFVGQGHGVLLAAGLAGRPGDDPREDDLPELSDAGLAGAGRAGRGPLAVQGVVAVAGVGVGAADPQRHPVVGVHPRADGDELL